MQWLWPIHLFYAKNVASPTQNYDGYQMCGHRSLITLYWCLVIQNILSVFYVYSSSLIDDGNINYGSEKMPLSKTKNGTRVHF